MADETVHILIDPDGNYGDVPVISEGEACESDLKMREFWLQSQSGQEWMSGGAERAAADAPAPVEAPVDTTPVADPTVDPVADPVPAPAPDPVPAPDPAPVPEAPVTDPAPGDSNTPPA